MTGNAHESEVAEFMKSGATMVWTKPIEMSSLKASIKEAADVKASLVQEQTTQENPEIAELKAKLAMKRAALQLASVSFLYSTHYASTNYVLMIRWTCES